MNERLDRASIIASFLCVSHCLFLPVLVAMAPFYWLQVIENEWVHMFLLLLTLPIAVAALVQGVRHHGQLSAMIVGAWGAFMLLLALLIGHDYPSWEMPITVVGASALIIAHLGNIMISRRQCSTALRVTEC